MKVVVAYIDPARFDQIRESLTELGFASLSALSASGTTPDALVTTTYRGASTQQHSRTKARLECVVEDDHASTVVQTVLSGGGERTFVYIVPVESAHPASFVSSNEPTPAGV